MCDKMLKVITILPILLCYSVSGFEDILKVSVYYETLCPDSIRFFRTQLNRTYEKIGSYFHVEFVPYGFATHQKDNGKWTFQCQHGERECNGNKLHACELAQGNGQVKDVEFISCSMRNRNPTSLTLLRNCADSVGINFTAITECFNSNQGDELLVKYGEQTEAVNPRIKYIPTIIINEVYNQKVQNDAEFDLLETVCDYLEVKPAECPIST